MEVTYFPQGYSCKVDDSIQKYAEWLSLLIPFYGLQSRGRRALDFFNRVVKFPIGDSYGHFPDTAGYGTPKDWESFESEVEDPALFQFMQKGVLAVMEYNQPVVDHYARDYQDVEGFISGHKFSGPVFVTIGVILIGEKLKSNLIQVPQGTTIESLKKKNDSANFMFNQGIIKPNLN